MSQSQAFLPIKDPVEFGKLVAECAATGDVPPSQAFKIAAFAHCNGMEDLAAHWTTLAASMQLEGPLQFLIQAQQSVITKRIDDAVRYLIAFIEKCPKKESIPLFNDWSSYVMAMTHAIFSTDRKSAAALYELMADYGLHDYHSILRICEHYIDLCAVNQAEKWYGLLLTRFRLDAFGLLAQAKIEELKGRSETATQALLNAADSRPGDIWLRNEICHRLLNFADIEQNIKAIESFSRDPFLDIEDVHRKLPALELRLLLKQRDLDAILRFLTDIDFEWDSINEHIYVDALYSLADYSHTKGNTNNEAILLIERYIANRYRSSEATIASLLHSFRVERRYAEAENLLDSISQEQIFNSPIVVDRRFQLHWEMGALEVANDLREKYWPAIDDLPEEKLRLGFYFTFETGQYEDASRHLITIIRRKFKTPDAQTVLHAVRAAKTHAEIIEQILVTDQVDADTQKLKQIIVDDICLHDNRRYFQTLNNKRLKASPHINALISCTSNAAPKLQATAGYLYVGQGDMMGALVFAASLAQTGSHNYAWYVEFSQSIEERWKCLFEMASERLGLAFTRIDLLESGRPQRISAEPNFQKYRGSSFSFEDPLGFCSNLQERGLKHERFGLFSSQLLAINNLDDLFDWDNNNALLVDPNHIMFSEHSIDGDNTDNLLNFPGGPVLGVKLATDSISRLTSGVQNDADGHNQEGRVHGDESHPAVPYPLVRRSLGRKVIQSSQARADASLPSEVSLICFSKNYNPLRITFDGQGRDSWIAAASLVKHTIPTQYFRQLITTEL